MQNFIKVQNSAKSLQDKVNIRGLQPRVGLILGTGLGSVADLLTDPLSVSFAELPDFPHSSVESHAGRFIVGELGNVPVIIQQGRCHLYEGYNPAEVCMGTRVMGILGVEKLVVTNAAGALNPQFEAGDVMLITDHINFTGMSPLQGGNADVFGPRFPDMSRAYDMELIHLAESKARERGIRLEKGVYAGVLGPQLETPAETRFLRGAGADAVGMSTVLEVIAARHMGLKVLGFSCLSNKNLPDCMAETSLDEVIRVAARAGTQLAAVLASLIESL